MQVLKHWSLAMLLTSWSAGLRCCHSACTSQAYWCLQPTPTKCPALSANALIRVLQRNKANVCLHWVTTKHLNDCDCFLHTFLMQMFCIFHCSLVFFFPILSSLSQTSQNSTKMLIIYTKSFSLWQLYNDSSLHMSKQPTLLKNTISLRDAFCSWFDLYLSRLCFHLNWVLIPDRWSFQITEAKFINKI